MKKKPSGFTLIEILVAMAVLFTFLAVITDLFVTGYTHFNPQIQKLFVFRSNSIGLDQMAAQLRQCHYIYSPANPNDTSPLTTPSIEFAKQNYNNPGLPKEVIQYKLISQNIFVVRGVDQCPGPGSCIRRMICRVSPCTSNASLATTILAQSVDPTGAGGLTFTYNSAKDSKGGTHEFIQSNIVINYPVVPKYQLQTDVEIQCGYNNGTKCSQ